MTLVARHAALTDIGLHRKTNEDAYVVAPPLFAVCDGMGGAQAGEVASGLAAETLEREVAAGTPLREAAEAANQAVFQRANDNIEQTGMGTTLTALVLDEESARFAHVGDSRAYLLRDGELQQLSDDHSLVGEMVRDGRLTPEEAAVHPHRSILSRALGTEPSVRVDEFAVDLQPGDTILLCSDGLCGVVAEDDIRRQLSRNEPGDAARKLIQEARKHGGPDNITAVVLRLEEAGEASAGQAGEVEAELEELEAETAIVAGEAEGPEEQEAVVGPVSEAPPAPEAGERPLRSRRRLAVLAVVLALVVLVALSGAVVMSLYYFVGVDDGRLTVYSGLPASIGPVPLHVAFRRSSVTYDSLSPEARRIVDEEQVGTRDEVLSLAADLGMWP